MINPIVGEIREAWAALAAEHGYDLSRSNVWARQQTIARQLKNKKEMEKSSQLMGDNPLVQVLGRQGRP